MSAFSSNAPRLLRHLAISVIFNTAIAAAITAFGKDRFSLNFLYSQLIGLSIWALIDVGRYWLHPQGLISLRQAMVLTLVGSVVGYFVGSAVGDVLLGNSPLHGWQKLPQQMAGFLLLSLTAGCASVYFFMSREVLLQERSQREQAQRQATQAQLKLLQSQLDPHMLFNTLANLRALIAQEPERAVQMLDQLGDFLRATLSASRAQEHSLQAEFDRLRDYFSLMQIRMGERLRFRLDLPAQLAQIQVPTLILQSLVENAVLHGLEPKVGGGQVWVSAHCEAGQLVLRVIDNGMGLQADTSPSSKPGGFGLAQVRERLKNHYGDQSTIDLIANNPISMRADHDIFYKNTMEWNPASFTSGCQATVRLPMQKLAS